MIILIFQFVKQRQASLRFKWMKQNIFRLKLPVDYSLVSASTAANDMLTVFVASKTSTCLSICLCPAARCPTGSAHCTLTALGPPQPTAPLLVNLLSVSSKLVTQKLSTSQLCERSLNC